MNYKTDKWLGFDFNGNGWSETHENKSEAFPKFARDFRSDLNSMLKGSDWKIEKFSANFFYISGFLYNTKVNRYVYFSISDVRYFQDSWSDNVLIRTAESTSDYTGGRNNSCYFKQFLQSVSRLTPFI